VCGRSVGFHRLQEPLLQQASGQFVRVLPGLAAARLPAARLIAAPFFSSAPVRRPNRHAARDRHIRFRFARRNTFALRPDPCHFPPSYANSATARLFRCTPPRTIHGRHWNGRPRGAFRARTLDPHPRRKEALVSKRTLMLAVLAGVATLQTGCFPRIRQVIANRWHMHQQLHGGACCTPAFKVPAQAASFGNPASFGHPVSFGQPGCCGAEAGIPMAHPGVEFHAPAGTPTIGAPMPLPGTPSPMPSKQ
jgi:hypothetical protein